jgi:amino acid adenylation domain-containing protein
MKNVLDKNVLLFTSRFVQQRKYWLDKLSGEIAQTGILPGCKKSRKSQKDMKKIGISIPGHVKNRLTRLSKGNNLSIYILLLAALKTLIYKYTGNEDVTILSPINKLKVTGKTINDCVLIRDRISGDLTFKELLLAIRESTLEAYANQDYPYSELIEYLFDSSQAGDSKSISCILCSSGNIHDDRNIEEIKSTISFSFLREGEDIKSDCFYDAKTYPGYYVEQVSRHLLQVLEHAADDVKIPINEISFLSTGEKERLIIEFNNTQVDYSKEKTLHGLFAEKVEQVPDHIAVVFEDKALTYRELNEKGNQLARVLRHRGLKPADIVGLMFHHSVDLVVGIFGVLKAGGACFLVDPGTPTSRAAAMLEDCRAAILLTRSDTVRVHSLTHLQGLRVLNVRPHVPGIRSQVTDLDSLPMPDRSLVDYGKYAPYIGDAMVKNTYISLQATRGCPYNCAYCHKIWPKSHVYRSAENILAEVKLYYDMGVRRFSFVDDIFNLNIKNSTRFYELLIKNGMDVELFFPNGMRGDILTGDYIDLLIAAGTRSFSMALETASPRLQKLIGKNINIEKLHENLEYACAKYPHIILELFTMHGFPTETKEEAMMTLDFIKSLKWLDFPYVNILRIYSHTEMEALALANGVKKSDIIRSEGSAYHELPDTLPFDRSFTTQYQADFLNEYFLLKERLLDVLPYQLQILTRDEIVQKYNSYLPGTITTFEDVLRAVGIKEEELGVENYLEEDYTLVAHLDQQMRVAFPAEEEPDDRALRILLLDVTQLFTEDKGDMLYDLVETPLGLMFLLTYLKRQFGGRIKGKILKSRIDFDTYPGLKALLKEFKPDVIGVRTLTFFKDFFHKTIALIRQWGFDVPIITGGPHTTANYTTILQDRNIDLAVLGEGEVTFAEVVQNILDNEGKLPGEEVLKEIAGIAFIPGEKASGKTFARQVLMLDELKDQLQNKSGGNLEPLNTSADLAFTVFTSGSTGKPKGTMLHHRGVANHVLTKIKELAVEPDDVMCHSLNIGFVASIWQFFAPLFTGAPLYVYPENIIANPYELFLRTVKDGVTVLEVVPSVLNAYLELVEAGKGPIKLEQLKRLVLTGEKVLPVLVNKFYNRYHIRLVNAYGQSECSDDTLHYHIPYNRATTVVPIGRPANNTRVYILGEDRELRPIGVPGELFIGGDGLAAGYLNRPELTAGKFIDTSKQTGLFSSLHLTLNTKHLTLFQTGDSVRYLPDGNIEYLGRVDHQVKIRGFRIEPGEIESRLTAIDGIREAVVIATRDVETGGPVNREDKYLCAYIVLDRAVDTPGLRKTLSVHLPDYMVPTYFVQLEAMPLTSSGKIDRKALPAVGIGDDGEYIPPEGDVEKKLVEIWSEVLAVDKDKIGKNANFFQLGGHSLMALQLIEKIHKTLNTRVPVEEIFNMQTLGQLAGYIEAAPEEEFIAIEPVEEKGYYVVSSAQKRMYTWQQMSPGSIVYNVSQVVSLLGEQNADLLEQTFRKLIKRHESLRTSFEIIHEEPIQRIHDYEGAVSRFQLEHYECKLKDDNMEQRSMEVQGILGRFIRPFALRRAPLIRVGLIHTPSSGHPRRWVQGSPHNSQGGIPGDQYILVVDMHHIISDGRSNDILIKDFMELYKGNRLQELNLQYKEFSEWQNRLIGGKVGSKQGQEEYWLKQFAGEIPLLNLPTDSARPEAPDLDGKSVYFEIDEETTEALRTLALKEETTLYMLFLALVNVLLSRLSGQEDIVVGAPLAGRRHADLENIIGFFVNTLPLRNFPSVEKPFLEFLKDVKDSTLKAFENQDYPFEELVEKLKIDRDTGRHPLFDVIVELRKVEGEPDRAGEAGAGSGEVEAEPGMRALSHRPYQLKTPFDLDFFVTEGGENMVVRILYMTELFKEETIQRFVGYFKDLLSSVLEDHLIKLENIKVSHDFIDIQPAVLESEQGDFGF